MNEQLVSPLIVYLIFNIKLFTLIMLLIGMVITMYFGLKIDSPRYTFKMRIIYGFIALIGAFMIIASLFIPDRTTLIAMYLSNYVTPENMEAVKALFNSLQ